MPARARAGAKRATNVSVRSDLLEQARAAGLNLSATLESALEQALAQEKRKRWREDNRQAVEKYNEHVESSGVFGDDVRGF